MDALQQDYRKERAWANPPFNLIGRFLARIKRQRATAVVVVPVWPTQPWWPLLAEMLTAEPVLLPHRSDLFLPGHLGNEIALLAPRWSVIACRISIRSALIAQGFSAGSAERIIRKWTHGTAGGYNAPWRRWYNHCASSRQCPFHAPVRVLADWLSIEAELGRKAGQINLFTSAIIKAQEVVTGRRELAFAPAIVAVKTAARRNNPFLPRHTDEEMWDPNLVLDYWRAHPPSTVARAVTLAMLAIILSTFQPRALLGHRGRHVPCATASGDQRNSATLVV